MSRVTTPRGTARAIRRRNIAPSVNYEPFIVESDSDEWFDHDAQQRYRNLRDEGHSHYAALLMAGLADPHE